MPPSSPSAATLRQLAALIHPGGVAAPAGPIAGSQELVAAAREHRVAALLARALEARGELAGLDDAARAALRRALLDQQQERAQLDALGAVAAAALDAAGIPFVALKGAALGAAHYPAPALRPMTDVDLLVAPGDKDRALAALAAAGFVRPPPGQEAFWAESFYNLPLDAPPGQAGKLELHWSIAQQGRHAPMSRGSWRARVRSRPRPAGCRSRKRSTCCCTSRSTSRTTTSSPSWSGSTTWPSCTAIRPTPPRRWPGPPRGG